MTDKTPDAKASTDQGETAETTSITPREDAKARFREALDRKKLAHHRSVGRDVNTGAVHGSETTGPVQKMFRRKSG